MSLWSCTHTPGLPLSLLCMGHLSDGSALSQGTKLVCPDVCDEAIMGNVEMLPQGKFHYDMEKKVLPMVVAGHWKQSQRCDHSIHIEPQVNKAQDLNIYHGVTLYEKCFD